jgi:hypothetical protein
MLLEFLDHFRKTKSPHEANKDEHRRQRAEQEQNMLQMLARLLEHMMFVLL